MSSHVPAIGIDPTERGPFDVLRDGLDELKAIVRENIAVLAGAVVLLVVAGWYFDVQVPGIPDVVKLAVLVAALSSGTLWVIGRKVAEWLHRPEGVLISEQDPVSGDQVLHHLAPDTFREMTVVNGNGKRREREFLHRVSINGREAYEVRNYFPEANHAVASWQAGRSSSEIRQDRKQMDRITHELEEAADRAVAMKSNQPQLVREQAADVINDLVRAFEGVELPEEKGYFQDLEESLDDDGLGPLLEDDERDDDDAGSHDPGDDDDQDGSGGELVTVEVSDD